MMFWQILSFVSLLLIAMTMLCRANDLRWRRGAKWQARLIGFMIAGTAPVGMFLVGWPFDAIFHFGLLLVFVTTPHLPPWWRWISGKEEASDTN